jgi:hypothetical protein
MLIVTLNHGPNVVQRDKWIPIQPPLTDSIPVSRTIYGGASAASCPQ